MSLLESLNDPNRHSQQPNSFAAVQTTWNKSGTKPPKAQTNTNSRNTAAAGSSGEKGSHEFQKEISRLDMKITKVATTVGTLYNHINLLSLRKKRKGAISKGRQTADAGRNSRKTGETRGNVLMNWSILSPVLEKIVNENSERQQQEDTRGVMYHFL